MGGVFEDIQKKEEVQVVLFYLLCVLKAWCFLLIYNKMMMTNVSLSTLSIINFVTSLNIFMVENKEKIEILNCPIFRKYHDIIVCEKILKKFIVFDFAQWGFGLNICFLWEIVSFLLLYKNYKANVKHFDYFDGFF